MILDKEQIDEGKKYAAELERKKTERARSCLTIEEAEAEAYFIESLLPCPCCGGRGEMDNIHVSGNLGHKWTFGIVCTKCALGHFLGYDTAEAARDAWNLRGGKKAS